MMPFIAWVVWTAQTIDSALACCTEDAELSSGKAFRITKICHFKSMTQATHLKSDYQSYAPDGGDLKRLEGGEDPIV